jgi:hypothetical protein
MPKLNFSHARHLIMPVKAPKKSQQPVQESEEEIAALALNEQGFLFQQRILETLEAATDIRRTRPHSS